MLTSSRAIQHDVMFTTFLQYFTVESDISNGRQLKDSTLIPLGAKCMTIVPSILYAECSNIHSSLYAGCSNIHSSLYAGCSNIHSSLYAGCSNIHSSMSAECSNIHSSLYAGCSSIHS